MNLPANSFEVLEFQLSFQNCIPTFARARLHYLCNDQPNVFKASFLHKDLGWKKWSGCFFTINSFFILFLFFFYSFWSKHFLLKWKRPWRGLARPFKAFFSRLKERKERKTETNRRTERLKRNGWNGSFLFSLSAISILSFRALFLTLITFLSFLIFRRHCFWSLLFLPLI